MNASVDWTSLVNRAIGGDQQAVTDLYNGSFQQVYVAVRAMLKDEDAVQDILQDAYIKGFENLPTLKNPEQYVAWMKMIATNRTRDWFRKKKPDVFSDIAPEGDETQLHFQEEHIDYLPEETLDRQETDRLIDEILASLPDDQRLAIALHYYQDMSVADIAEMMGCSTGTYGVVTKADVGLTATMSSYTIKFEGQGQSVRVEQAGVDRAVRRA